MPARLLMRLRRRHNLVMQRTLMLPVLLVSLLFVAAASATTPRWVSNANGTLTAVASFHIGDAAVVDCKRGVLTSIATGWRFSPTTGRPIPGLSAHVRPVPG